jgi:hypothetical protein
MMIILILSYTEMQGNLEGKKTPNLFVKSPNLVWVTPGAIVEFRPV